MKNNGYCVRAFRSDGSTFCYENEDFMMTEFDGADSPEIEIFKENQGLGDGCIITGKRKSPKPIKIMAVPRNYNNGDYKNLRKKALFFHNLAYTYDVEITYMGETRVAKDCELHAFSMPTEKYRKNGTLTVSFLSPHAGLFANNSDASNFSSITPGWAVTRAYLPGKKLIYATEDRTDSIIVNYEGSTDTKPVITITADGYVKNLSITVGNATESLIVEAYKGDVIIIDASKSFATKNAAMIPITAGADYRRLILHPGDNQITVKAENGSAFKTSINYVGRYDGI